MAIAYSVRVSSGGTDSFHELEYFGLITLASREFRVLLAVLPASLRCLRIFASSVSHGVATPPLLPTLTVYYREVPLLDFGLVWYWSGVFCSVCADCADDYSAGPCACLAQGCRCGGFFPNSAVFALVLGTSVLAYGILALPLLFLGYVYGVAFFDFVCLSSAYLYPAVAVLVGFSCGPPSLVVPVCVWDSSEAVELYLLSLLLLGVG